MECSLLVSVSLIQHVLDTVSTMSIPKEQSRTYKVDLVTRDLLHAVLLDVALLCRPRALLLLARLALVSGDSLDLQGQRRRLEHSDLLDVVKPGVGVLPGVGEVLLEGLRYMLAGHP